MFTQLEKSIMVCKASFYHARCPQISESQPSLATITTKNSLQKMLPPLKHTAIPSAMPVFSCSTHPCHLHITAQSAVSRPRQCSHSPPGKDDVAQLTICDAWCTAFINFQTKASQISLIWFFSMVSNGNYMGHCRLATLATSTYGP